MKHEEQPKPAKTGNFSENIPQFFKDAQNWVCWRFLEVNGRRTKPPTDAQGRKVSVTDPKNFMSFGDALAAYQGNDALDGIGFALTPDAGLCCIDLDHCFNEGRLLTQAWMVLRDLGPTYVERSPSGEGLHVWIKASLPNGMGGRRFKTPDGAEVEIYNHGRFLTMTGNRFEVAGYPHHPQVEAKQAEVEALISRLEAARQTPPPAAPSAPQRPATSPTVGQAPPPVDGGQARPLAGGWQSVALDYGPPTNDDLYILHRMMNHPDKGEKITRLWRGEATATDYHGDDSGADMALLNHLAFWTRGDARSMCRLFTASKMGERDKWRREDYARRTIARALEENAGQAASLQDLGGYAPPGIDAAQAPTYLADTARGAWEAQRARLAEEEQAAREEAANALADAILANAQAATDRTEEPPPIRYIINPQLTDDTGVAFLVGPGGGGKSFQALIRCIAIASGRPIGKAHQTEVTAPALFFSLEDPPKVLQRRYFHTIAAIEEHYGPFTAGQLAALDANLYRLPVRGQMGALMELDGKGNPRPTNDYHAVRKIIERTSPVLVVLDTMSRALGVDEQSNNHAAQWIAALERILFDYPETIFMIVGHTGKPGKGNQEEKADDPLSLRGASAFAWNARAVENYTKASDRERKFLGMESDNEVFKLTLPKHNYTPNLDGPIFFWRDAHGVPIEIDAEAMKNAKAQKAYDDAVRAVPVIAQAWEAKGRKLVKRDWVKRLGVDMTEPAKPKPGPEQIAHDALIKCGIISDQVESVIAEAIRRGYVKTVEGERKGKRGPAPLVVEFVELPPDVDD